MLGLKRKKVEQIFLEFSFFYTLSGFQSVLLYTSANCYNSPASPHQFLTCSKWVRLETVSVINITTANVFAMVNHRKTSSYPFLLYALASTILVIGTVVWKFCV